MTSTWIRGPSLETVAGRSWVVAEGRRLGPVTGRADPPHQLVLKVAGKAKSPRAVRRMALYMGRWTAEFRANGLFGSAELADEGGRPIAVEELAATLESWRLVPDAANLSSLARSVGEDAAILPERDRLRHVQAVHLTWSVNGDAEPPGPRTRQALANATLAAMDELFARRGFQGLWAMHDVHPAHDDRRAPDRRAAVHPHVHILVPTLSAAGAVLSIERDFLDDARAVIARHARREGLNVTAERREDRAEVRDRVLAGEERLRHGWKRGQEASADRLRGLAAHAPVWFVRHGGSYERRRAELRRLRVRAREEAERAAATREPSAALVNRLFREMLPPGDVAAPPRRIEPELRELAAAAARSFEDPTAAVRSFAELAREGAYAGPDGALRLPNRARADWYMRKNPLVFGRITRSAWRHRRDVRVIKALRETRIASSPEIRVADSARAEAVRRSAADAARPAAAERDRRVIVASLRRLALDTEDVLRAASRAEAIRRVAADVERRPYALAARDRGRRAMPERSRPADRGQGVERDVQGASTRTPGGSGLGR